MENNEFRIPLGVVCSEEFLIGEEHIAKHVGSGNVRVLSTPSMIAFMERTSMNCVQRYLPEGYTTVGVLVNVKHVNPAPVGSTIRVESRIVLREGRKLVFEVKAYYGDLLIGEGVHERFIVNTEKFIDKVKKLLESRGSRQSA
ncbi:MAG: thioesterase family protein [Desulfurococcaceae archaeon]